VKTITWCPTQKAIVLHRWMLQVTGGSGTARDRLVGESSISGL
jgi:hypothetical protein